MNIVGTVESLWRYPVKSMRGEELHELFASFAGVYGDRLFAFKSSAAHEGLPFLTGRDQHKMIRYRPRFRDSEKSARPINLNAAEKVGANPVSAGADGLGVDVETPDGKIFAIDDPQLVKSLTTANHHLTLHRSEKALTDSSPLSIIAVQTVKRIGEEAGVPADKRRFRANVYLDLRDSDGFTEDKFVGKALRLGPKVVAQVLKRDGRCVMITLDPDTAEKTPVFLKTVAQAHDGMAGVYAAVLAEGIIRKGDPIELL